MNKPSRERNAARDARPLASATVLGEWQLQDAKARFSQLFRRARDEGPQRVTRHGKDAVVVLSAEQYDRLAARQRGSLVEFFARSPLRGVKLDLTRAKDYGRDVEL